jgi:aryl-alcohol dehydrogenase-like predicted oxidoreductase
MKILSPVAFGTWSWGVGAIGGDQVFGNNLDAASLKPVFDAGVQSGLTLWDTATAYGIGSSESILGELARGRPRHDVLLSTKFTPQMAPSGDRPVEAMLEASLQRLGTDHVDIYWIHNPHDVRRWTPGLIPLLKSGKVKSVGVSNHNLEEIKLAEGILAKEGSRISAVQNHYSLLYRSSEDAGILNYCRDNGITFFAYMVLEQGALSGKYDTRHPLPEGSGRGATYNRLLPQLEKLTGAMREVGQARGASVAQVAIAWAIAKKTLPIIGVTRTSHIDDAIKAGALTLSAQEIERIESLAAKANVDTKAGWEDRMA